MLVSPISMPLQRPEHSKPRVVLIYNSSSLFLSFAGQEGLGYLADILIYCVSPRWIPSFPIPVVTRYSPIMALTALSFTLLALVLAELFVVRAFRIESNTFHYTQVTTDLYPTPLRLHLSFPTSFASPFCEASTLLPAEIVYTTYFLLPTATLAADGQYGQCAYAALWANISYTNSPPFTTTVSPTPLPSRESVYPPDLPVSPVGVDNLNLPAGFIWGVAGSAWQMEGALQLEGRGPSLLDHIGAKNSAPGMNDSNVSDMNYFLYRQDIARLAAMGFPYNSFSISWSRIVPFGLAGTPINIEVLHHYGDVIDACLEYGVTPIVTLLHFDLP